MRPNPMIIFIVLLQSEQSLQLCESAMSMGEHGTGTTTKTDIAKEGKFPTGYTINYDFPGIYNLRFHYPEGDGIDLGDPTANPTYDQLQNLDVDETITTVTAYHDVESPFYLTGLWINNKYGIYGDDMGKTEVSGSVAGKLLSYVNTSYHSSMQRIVGIVAVFCDDTPGGGGSGGENDCDEPTPPDHSTANGTCGGSCAHGTALFYQCESNPGITEVMVCNDGTMESSDTMMWSMCGVPADCMDSFLSVSPAGSVTPAQGTHPNCTSADLCLHGTVYTVTLDCAPDPSRQGTSICKNGNWVPDSISLECADANGCDPITAPLVPHSSITATCECRNFERMDYACTHEPTITASSYCVMKVWYHQTFACPPPVPCAFPTNESNVAVNESYASGEPYEHGVGLELRCAYEQSFMDTVMCYNGTWNDRMNTLSCPFRKCTIPATPSWSILTNPCGGDCNHGQLIDYHCKFYPDVTRERECSDGSWNRDPIECLSPAGCPELATDSSVSTNITCGTTNCSHPHGTGLRIYCSHEISYFDDVSCHNGTWLDGRMNTLSCPLRKCTIPDTPAWSVLTNWVCGETTCNHGDSIDYHCEFYPDINKRRECQDSSWSETAINCPSPVGCAQPSTDARVSMNITCGVPDCLHSHRTGLRFYCKHDTGLFDEMNCNNGTWEPFQSITPIMCPYGDCAVPAVPPNAALMTMESCVTEATCPHNTGLLYHCLYGSGDSDMWRCNDGQWKWDGGQVLVCPAAKECAIPDLMGKATTNDTCGNGNCSHQAVVQLECKYGLKDTIIGDCNDGNWVLDVDFVFMICSDPQSCTSNIVSDLFNQNDSCTTCEHDTTINYSCKHGQDQNSATTTCYNGNWKSWGDVASLECPYASCKIHHFDDLATLNDTCGNGNCTHDTAIEYYCKYGDQLTDSYICRNGVWDPVLGVDMVCFPPRQCAISNPQLTELQVNDTCTGGLCGHNTVIDYSCVDWVEKRETTTCFDSAWSEWHKITTLNCTRPGNCSSTAARYMRSNVSCEGGCLHDTAVETHCLFDAQEHIAICDDGRWKPGLLQCPAPQNCTQPVLPEHGILLGSSYNHESVVQLQCSFDSQTKNSTCRNGQWSSDLSVTNCSAPENCEIPTDSHLTTITNSNCTLEQCPHGTTIEQQCKYGNPENGSITCHNGGWSASLMNCLNEEIPMELPNALYPKTVLDKLFDRDNSTCISLVKEPLVLRSLAPLNAPGNLVIVGQLLDMKKYGRNSINPYCAHKKDECSKVERLVPCETVTQTQLDDGNNGYLYRCGDGGQCDRLGINFLHGNGQASICELYL